MLDRHTFKKSVSSIVINLRACLDFTLRAALAKFGGVRTKSEIPSSAYIFTNALVAK